MKDVLKEFCKGEIRPEETWPPMGKEQKLRLRKIDEAQQRLLNELSEKEKKEWLEPLDIRIAQGR